MENNKGFTLVELAVIVSITVLMTVLVFSNYGKNNETFALERASQKLSQDIRRAQEMAISGFEGGATTYGYGIYFDTANSLAYTIYEEKDADGLGVNMWWEGIDTLKETINIEKGITICDIKDNDGVSNSSVSKISVSFEPPNPLTYIGGVASDHEASIVLCVASDASKQKIIKINNVGKVEIANLYTGTEPIDVDGNYYGEITIGTQTWMAKNLMTTRYRDKTAIARGPVGATWDGADHGYYAYPPNTANNAEESLANIQANNLGFVYQQSAANNAKGLCPVGWHVPSDAEFKILIEYLGTTSCEGTGNYFCSPAGASLKEAGTVHWNAGNTGTNTSGFSAVGTGYRSTAGVFAIRSVASYLWSSSSIRYLYFLESRVFNSVISAANGVSVRCLKD